MKKENFMTLIFGTISGILFALGMCMCLITQWAAFHQGIIVSAVGFVIFLIMLIVRRKMQGKKAISLNAKALGTVALGVTGTLVLGVGMCMSMVWQGLFIWGIVVGFFGILMLLCLIPLCKGLQ